MSAISDLVADGVLVPDFPLGAMTTYKAGGPARFLARVNESADLKRLIESGVTQDHPLLVIGRGSNLVVSDHGFPGVVVHLGAGFTRIDFAVSGVVAGGAVPLPRLARATAHRGLSGLEFFVGIPGSVGGAVRQNAGCFGTETVDRLMEATIVDLITGEESVIAVAELDLGYRNSNLRSEHLVVEARFSTSHGDKQASGEQIRVITRWRRDNQPGGTLNAGSVFKNPSGTTAGELIDSLGLKGLDFGDVAVSTKHANFFVAGPGASADDIYRLVTLVKDRVFEASGTMLETEIQFVGFEQ